MNSPVADAYSAGWYVDDDGEWQRLPLHTGPGCVDWPWCWTPTEQLQACADEVELKLATGELPDPDGSMERLLPQLRIEIGRRHRYEESTAPPTEE